MSNYHVDVSKFIPGELVEKRYMKRFNSKEEANTYSKQFTSQNADDLISDREFIECIEKNQKAAMIEVWELRGEVYHRIQVNHFRFTENFIENLSGLI